jgi:uncharacterized protein (TIGR00156 family)
MSNSRMKAIYAVITLGAASAFFAPASAQYTGPSDKAAAKTVAEVLKVSKDDDRVALKGMLIRQVSHEKYMFSDGTGEIQVDIDDKVFPKVPVDDKTTIEISGEVDKGLTGKIEVDVKAVQILK